MQVPPDDGIQAKLHNVKPCATIYKLIVALCNGILSIDEKDLLPNVR